MGESGSLMAAVQGRVWKFGDDINTDLVIPGFAIYLPADEQPRHCFSANRPGWVDEVADGDILLAGRTFGVGSGRPIGEVFARLGIKAVVAESFNGLGLRNCVNVGLPSLPCPGILDAFDEGDVAEVDAVSGEVRNLTSGVSITGNPLPPAIQEIVDAGGVEARLRASGHLMTPEGSNT
jgi:3-isopropylmalate/(R)-2-methylmalate dehydratase small subunit